MASCAEPPLDDAPEKCYHFSANGKFFLTVRAHIYIIIRSDRQGATEP